jgi:hypothetical protein
VPEEVLKIEGSKLRVKLKATRVRLYDLERLALAAP